MDVELFYNCASIYLRSIQNFSVHVFRLSAPLKFAKSNHQINCPTGRLLRLFHRVFFDRRIIKELACSPPQKEKL